MQALNATYDPVKAGEEIKEFEGEEMGFFDMVFRFASTKDKLMWWVATLNSVAFGAAMPGFCLFFGDMIQGVGASEFDMLDDSAKWMAIIGAIAAVTSFFFISMYSLFSVQIASQIQINYFRAALTKDAAYYD